MNDKQALRPDPEIVDGRVVRLAVTELAGRLRELLAPIDATSVTLTRDEAVLAMSFLEGLAVHLDPESEAAG